MLRRYIRRAAYLEDIDLEDNDLEDENREQRARSRLLNKRLRDSSDPFSLPEREFKKSFRLSRYVARELLDEILANNPLLRNVYSNAIPFHLKFLGALNFFGNGSNQKPTGDNRVYPQAQPSFSRGLKLVCKELLKLSGKYVRFPSTPAEISSTKANFMVTLRMPGIVCAIDGTHVAISKPPSSENGYLYYNRKQYYSLNVLAACDAHMKILFADANYPGSVHDSAVWHMSELKRKMPGANCYMLGDSGFPSDPCMLTPVSNALPGTKEARYNIAHKHARNVVERAFGLLKMRFMCLTKSRTLYYRPKMAGNITYACIILHNICVMRNIEAEEDEDYVADVQVDQPDAVVIGRRVRDMYINQHF